MSLGNTATPVGTLASSGVGSAQCAASCAPSEVDDHPIREIAAVVDLKWVYAELAPHYPRLGRPSVILC
jgi:hypothetical protein